MPSPMRNRDFKYQLLAYCTSWNVTPGPVGPNPSALGSGQPFHPLGNLGKVTACLDVRVPVGRVGAANALELGDGTEAKSQAAGLHRVTRKALGVCHAPVPKSLLGIVKSMGSKPLDAKTPAQFGQRDCYD